jgi:sugar/nucleoside kinase (ribokinase family)
MSTPFDVLGIGTNSVDLVYVLPQLPEADGPLAKLPISAHRVSPGGQTATAMCACVALGLRAAYLGATGNDAHGALVRDALVRRGVNTDLVVTRDVPNRYAVILVDGTGDRIVLWTRDPRLSIPPDALPHDLASLARVVHVDDEDQLLAIAAGRRAREAGLIVTSDIDRITPRTRDVVDAVTIPIFGEHVPAELSGVAGLEGALRALRRPHHTMLCVTLGARGAMLLAGDRVHYAPAFDVDAVDTTGAGDVFRAAFIAALLRGDDPEAMLRYANAAAAVACTRQGAIGGVPSFEDISQLVATKNSK